MQSLLILMLSSAGLSWIITRSKICKNLRERISFKKQVYELAVVQKNNFIRNLKMNIFTFLEDVTNCFGCMGFWAGAICYLLQIYNCDIVLFAFIGAMSSNVLIGLFNFLDKK